MVGHTDAIWDLALVRDESLLVSCGAEGAVKVWDVNGNGALKLSWGYGGVGVENHSVVGATAVEGIKTDLRSVAVAYRDAVVKIFDLETGKETARLRSDVSYGKLSVYKRLIWGY
jgi:striatin 1/3/4